MGRYKRRYRNKRTVKDKLIYIFLFGIVSPIIAITLGSFLVKYIIYPGFFINQDTEQVIIEDNTKEVENNTNTLNIFNIQIGGFNDLNNAKALKESVNNKGLPAYVVKLDNYKVFSGTFLSKEHAEEYKKHLDQNIEESFLHENTINIKTTFGDDLKKEDNEKILQLINKCNDIYISETSIWKETLISKKSKDIKTRIQKNNDDLNEIYESIKVETQIMKNFKKTLESRKKIASEINDKNILENYSDYTKTLVGYINIIRTK
ncbi:SPOR domain-containing protein [Senegalia massiliensis]|uniref:SPOR domain-containing protein n=1 Tax=Senegalia massiliensis TaxID=1720316 RepID=A0A845QX63_9CLOT|nr:SPOR domain-containing protein [Senegalia massiliensis]NBI05742.1 SPOR domain-containing protein [Senegalia massiliensis]